MMRNRADTIRLTVAALMLVALASALPALAAGVGGVPAAGLGSLSGVHRLELPAVDVSKAAREDSRRKAEGLPPRFAEPRPVQLTPADGGTWEWAPSGRRLWRMRILCPGAHSLNLGFTEFEMPPGGHLLVYAEDGSGPVLRFDGRDHRPHGQLWTPLLRSEAVVVELSLPAGGDDFRLRLSQVGCGYRKLAGGPDDQSGSCNVDVVCDEGDAWRQEIASVGVITINGTWYCSGAMVNNTAEDHLPLFLTAFHCFADWGADPTVVVYWNFESPVCGEQDNGSIEQFTLGASRRASSSTSDFYLLELDEAPAPEFGVNYAGWDRSGAVPGRAVAIHHPSTAEKSISFEDDPLSVTSYLSAVSPGNGTHLRVADWDQGTTEGGSSGSPLFDPQHRIVGQLHGGYAACGNDQPDWYGRLFTSWEGDGTADTRLRDHLDPEDLGPLTLDLLLGPGVEPPPPDNAKLRLAAYGPNPFLDFVEFTVVVDRDVQGTGRIYDLAGRLRARLQLDPWVAGENSFAWGGRGLEGQKLAAGVYVLILEADGRRLTQQVMYLN